LRQIKRRIRVGSAAFVELALRLQEKPAKKEKDCSMVQIQTRFQLGKGLQVLWVAKTIGLWSFNLHRLPKVPCLHSGCKKEEKLVCAYLEEKDQLA
jgi:hypothetical protein